MWWLCTAAECISSIWAGAARDSLRPRATPALQLAAGTTLPWRPATPFRGRGDRGEIGRLSAISVFFFVGIGRPAISSKKKTESVLRGPESPRCTPTSVCAVPSPARPRHHSAGMAADIPWAPASLLVGDLGMSAGPRRTRRGCRGRFAFQHHPPCLAEFRLVTSNERRRRDRYPRKCLLRGHRP